MDICLHLSLGNPTHATILLWTKKQGAGNFREKEFFYAQKWILIADESIQFGNKKLCIFCTRCTHVYHMILIINQGWPQRGSAMSLVRLTLPAYAQDCEQCCYRTSDLHKDMNIFCYDS